MVPLAFAVSNIRIPAYISFWSPTVPPSVLTNAPYAPCIAVATDPKSKNEPVAHFSAAKSTIMTQ